MFEYHDFYFNHGDSSEEFFILRILGFEKVIIETREVFILNKNKLNIIRSVLKLFGPYFAIVSSSRLTREIWGSG